MALKARDGEIKLQNLRLYHFTIPSDDFTNFFFWLLKRGFTRDPSSQMSEVEKF